MINDSKVLQEFELKEKQKRKRIEEEYPEMSPFLCGVSRASNISVYNKTGPIYPYTEH